MEFSIPEASNCFSELVLHNGFGAFRLADLGVTAAEVSRHGSDKLVSKLEFVNAPLDDVFPFGDGMAPFAIKSV